MSKPVERPHSTAKVASGKSSKFGFWSIVFLAINSIIGTGIFLSPAGVVKIAGSWTPWVYVIAGAFAAVLAVTFAAAAKYVSTNGAAYAYAHTAFGDDVGFYVGITRFVAGAIAWGVMATAVVSSTLGIFGGTKAVTTVNITIGFVILIGILLAINIAGTRITRWFNDISTIGKVAALLVVIVGGVVIFLISGQNHIGELSSLTAGGKSVIPVMNTTTFVTAVLAAFYAYTGFESTATAASEFGDPAKDIPKAIPIALGVVTFVYVGVVTIALVINPVGILNSTEPVILASAFENPVLRGIVVVGAIISMFGINVAASFSTPRVFDALARRRQVPSFISKQSSRGVPIAAFLITAALAIAIPMAFSYSMKGIMVISSVSRFIQFLVVPMAVIVFFLGRAKQKTNPAQRNLLTDVILPVIGFIASIFLLWKFDWVGQFSTVTGGVRSLNWWAISAMIIGYVVLPLALYIPWKSGAYRRAKGPAESTNAHGGDHKA